MHNLPILALDFETFYAPKYTLSSMTTKEYVLDPRFKIHGVGVRYVHEPGPSRWIAGHAAAVAYLQSIDWEQTAVLCQNANFDVFILMQRLGIKPAFIHDTAVMARQHMPNHPAGLDFIAARYIGKRKGKELIKTYGIRDLTPELCEMLGKYCVLDNDLMIGVFEHLLPHIPWDMQRLTDIAIRLHTDPALVADVPRLEAFKEKERQRAIDAIAATGLDKSRLSSNDKFAAYIEELGLPVPMKPSPSVLEPDGSPKMIPAFAKNDLQFQLLQNDYPEYEAVWEARIAAKSRINETRAQRFIDATMPDGTIPMPLKVSGAHTHRFSGFDKMNVQNMPRGSELRKSLKAPDGMLVYVLDLSNIEARLNAWLARQADKVALFKSGADIYARFATKLYGFEVDKNDHPKERFVGKVAELGLGYGMGWKRFANVLRSGAMGMKMPISDEEAQKVVNVWRQENYMITNHWDNCTQWLWRMMDRNQGPMKYGPLTIDRERIWLPSGLCLHYPDLKYDSEDGQIKYWNAKSRFWVKMFGGKTDENIIQSLANCIIQEAILRVTDEVLPHCDGRFVLQVHDELIFLASDKNPDETLEAMRQAIIVVSDWAEGLPIEAEGGYAKEYSK